jgi:hypothetical protein
MSKRAAVAAEGPEAAGRFDRAMGKILTVSKDDLARREAEYTEANRHKAKRGPKPTKK